MHQVATTRVGARMHPLSRTHAHTLTTDLGTDCGGIRRGRGSVRFFGRSIRRPFVRVCGHVVAGPACTAVCQGRCAAGPRCVLHTPAKAPLQFRCAIASAGQCADSRKRLRTPVAPSSHIR